MDQSVSISGVDQLQQNTRKQHNVNNQPINTVNQYTDWIQIARQKLKERERRLLEIKIIKIESIINEQLKNKHFNTNFSVKQDLINITLTQLDKLIDNWQGLVLSRVKKSVIRYNDYFASAKGWYDQSKKKLFGALFWLPIFKNIDKKQIDLLMTITQLFNGSVKYNHTRPVRLINAGTVMCSSEMQNYLLGLDSSLQIKQWMQQCNSNQMANTIMNKIQSQLNYLSTINKQNINSNNNNNSIIQTFPIQTPQLTIPNINNNINYMNNVINSTYSRNNNMYGGNHRMFYQCKNFRFSPIMCGNIMPCNYYIVIGSNGLQLLTGSN